MADKYDIHIDQGANYRMFLDYRNPDNTGISLTGYTFKMQIKSAPGGTTHFTSTNAMFTLDNSVQGRVVFNIPAATTRTMNWDSGVYDIIATAPDGTVTRFVQGQAFLDKAVTT